MARALRRVEDVADLFGKHHIHLHALVRADDCRAVRVLDRVAQFVDPGLVAAVALDVGRVGDECDGAVDPLQVDF